ncbi:hypothetical protein [Methyloglobulus sp.]|uniref:hypothetical protein n=1 Tax=Methyloglobulus sp. TaxID=2518622 RepID=UPI00398A249E
MKPTVNEIATFLRNLLSDGRLHTADIEILKAHAKLPNRSGVNWEIAKAASKGVVKQWSCDLTQEVKKRNPQWQQEPTWHTVDSLQRWLGHALAERFPYYNSLIQERQNHTKRWWMALGESVDTQTINGKVTASRLRNEIAEALDKLTI